MSVEVAWYIPRGSVSGGGPTWQGGGGPHRPRPVSDWWPLLSGRLEGGVLERGQGVARDGLGVWGEVLDLFGGGESWGRDVAHSVGSLLAGAGLGLYLELIEH